MTTDTNTSPAARASVLNTGPTVTITALPRRVNLVTYAGDDLNLILDVRDQDGQPADITHMTVTAQVRHTPAADIIAAEFDTTIDQAQAGVAYLRLPPAATATLPGRAVWDAQVAWGGTSSSPDHVATLVAGTVTVSPDVTRQGTQP